MPIWLRGKKKDSWVVICYNWQAKFAFMPLIISLMWFICKIQNVTDFRVVHCPTWEVKKKSHFFSLFLVPTFTKRVKYIHIVFYHCKPENMTVFTVWSPLEAWQDLPQKWDIVFLKGRVTGDREKWVAWKLSPATKKKQPDLFRGDFPIAFSGHARLTLCHLLA